MKKVAITSKRDAASAIGSMINSRKSFSRATFVYSALLFIALLSFLLIKTPLSAGSSASYSSDDYRIMPGKEVYHIGDMVHLFTFPDGIQYEIEVYGPDGKIIANGINFIAEKPGHYTVRALLGLFEDSRNASASFDVVQEDTALDAGQADDPGQPASNESSSESTDDESNPPDNITDEANKGKASQTYSLEDLVGARVEHGGKRYGKLKMIDVNFSDSDVKILDGKENTMELEKDGISIRMKGADRTDIKNAGYNNGILHVDSLPIEEATISLPHEELPPVSLLPKLYVRTDNESDFMQAQPYEKDGKIFNKIKVNPEDYEFDVGHFSDYYVDTSPDNYINLTSCLAYINKSVGNSCVINSNGTWFMNGSLTFNITPAAFSGVIEIAATNVTLNCNHSTIIGTNDSITYGIYVGAYVNASISNCSIQGYGSGIYLDGSTNATIMNNILKDNIISGISMKDSSWNRITNNTMNHTMDGASAYGIYMDNSDNNNLSYNTMESNSVSYRALRITSWTSSDDSVWNNSFYSGGVEDFGTNTIFCISNGGNLGGNFYRDSIPGSLIPSSDCGPARIIEPTDLRYQNHVFINWTNQSSPHNISYHLQYSNDSGNNWYGIDSTSLLWYDWNVSGVAGGTQYSIKLIPYDYYYYTEYNATNNVSMTFTMVQDNQWVCSDISLCEYQNITGAMIGEDNTNNTIVLMEPFGNYTIEGQITYHHNLTPPMESHPAILINATNITLNCSNSAIFSNGTGYAIYSAESNITVVSCILGNFSAGIYIYNSSNSNLKNNTLYNNTLGIELINTTYTTLADNHAYNNSIGISINTSSSSIIMNNTLSYNNLYGIGIYYSNDTALDENTAYNNTYGIYITHSNNSIIKENHLYNNSLKGAYLSSSHHNNLSNNTLSGNTEMGIYLLHSSNNTLAYNDLINNTNYGIFIDGNSDQNNMTGNTFESIYSPYYDLSISTIAASNNSVWLNNFYTSGVDDLGTGTQFCIENEGNFYEEHITPAKFGSNDCGIVNIISPQTASAYAWALPVRWNKQSSINTISYQLLYSADDGSSWNSLISTSSLSYLWDISGLIPGGQYLIKAIPNNGRYNSTNDTVNFTMDSPPVNLSAILNATSPYNLTVDNLTANAINASDINGDNISFNYNWYLNGSSLLALNMPFTAPDKWNKTYDFSGNGMQGTVYGAVWNSTQGVVGGGFDFDGADDYVLVQDNESINFTTQPFSIEAWIFKRGNGTSASTGLFYNIVGKYKPEVNIFNASTYSYMLGVINESLSGVENATAFLVSGTGGIYAVTGPAISTGQWYQIVGVWNGTDLFLYVNGTLQDTDSAPTIINTVDANLTIGASQVSDLSHQTTAFNGFIDEVRVYKRALTTEEISNHYSLHYHETVSQEIKRGENWSVRITPIDEWGLNGSSAMSNNVTILNNVSQALLNVFNQTPTNIPLQFVNETNPVNPNQNLTIRLNATIMGGAFDTVWITIWQTVKSAGDILWQGLMSFVGDFWQVEIPINDSYPKGLVNYTIYANFTNFTSVDTIELDGNFSVNTPPGITSTILNATSASNLTMDNLTASAVATDADGNTVQLNYNWYKNGVSDTLFNMPFTAPDRNNLTYDFSGNNYTCLVVNEQTAIWNATGGYDSFGAFQFYNAGGYINVTNFVWPAGSPVTVSLWVKPQGSYAGSAFGVGWDTLKRFQAHVPWNDNVLYWDYGDFTGNGRISTDLTPYINTWTHIVLVSNGSYNNFKAIYIDGNLAASDTTSDAPDFDLTSLTIGGALDFGGTFLFYFDGTEDEFRIWNRVLSANEIGLLYSNETNMTHSDAFKKGDNWSVMVTPIDQWGLNGSSVMSNNVTILNNVSLALLNMMNQTPTNIPLQLINEILPINPNQNLTIRLNATIMGGAFDTVWITIWQTVKSAGDILWQGLMSLVGDFWQVEIPINDSYPKGLVNYTIYANFTNFTSVDTIELDGNFSVNTQPEIASVLLNATSPGNLTTDNLTANPYSVNDNDTNAVVLNYNWYKNAVSDAFFNMPFTAPDRNNLTYDFSGNNYNGLVVNEQAAIWNATGGYDSFGAFQFSNAGGYINVTDFVWPAGSPVTVSLWVKPRGNYNGSAFGVGWDTLKRFQAHIPWENNVLYWDYGDYSANGRISTDLTPYIDTWAHIVLVSNGSYNNFKAIYVNGNLAASDTTSDAPDFDLTYLTIGGALDIGGTSFYYFNGTIDELRIWKRVLSANEIGLLYANETNMTHSDALRKGDNWSVMVTPIDSYGLNGTGILSNPVKIRLGNTFVCADFNICEYQNLTEALTALNNTNSTIYMIEPNATYTLRQSSYNLSPSSDYPSIVISSDNITVDCNGTSFWGSAMGSAFLINGNYTLLKNCSIYNYSYGIMINSSYDNLTQNTIDYSADYDMNLTSGSNSNNLWLNSLYDKGAINEGASNSFCISGKGNFYEQGINKTYILGVLNDCGPANITFPDAGGSYKGSLNITWTPQSSANSISYYVYYSDNTGTSWNYLASTSLLQYSWDITNLFRNTTYLVEIRPYDLRYNATIDNSSLPFMIIPNNNIVCSNITLCEYGNLSDALGGENNTNSTIYIDVPDVSYTLSPGMYNLSPSGDYPAIVINASNVTVDCNGSEISDSGRGYGIYTEFDNITIINCIITNYTSGIYLNNSAYDLIANNTISQNTGYGLYLSNTNYTNVTGNSFNNSDSIVDLFTSSTNGSIWLNNFYGNGTNDASLNTSYCVGGYGNYYSSSIPPANIFNGSCGVLSQPYADSDSDGYYTTTDCNDNAPATYPGAAEACDGIDNNCDGTVDGGCPGSTTSFVSHGTGGGIAIIIKEYTITEDEISVNISSGETVILHIDDLSYKMRLSRLYQDSAELTMPDMNRTFKVGLGKTIETDLDNDTKNDLSMTLEAVPDSKIILGLKKISAPSITGAAVDQSAETGAEPTGETQAQTTEEQRLSTESPAVIAKGPEQPLSIVYIIAIALGVLLLLGSAAGAIVHAGRKGKKIKSVQEYANHMHSLGYEKEEIHDKLASEKLSEHAIRKVLDNVKELDSFIQAREHIGQRLVAGSTKDEIKDEMMKAGWPEDYVDMLLRLK